MYIYLEEVGLLIQYGILKVQCVKIILSHLKYFLLIMKSHYAMAVCFLIMFIHNVHSLLMHLTLGKKIKLV